MVNIAVGMLRSGIATRGTVVLAASAALAAAGVLRVDGVLLALGLAGAGLLGVAWILGRWNLSRLGVGFEGPCLAVAGDRVRALVALENRSRLWDAVDLRVGLTGPGGMHFEADFGKTGAGSSAQVERAERIPLRGKGRDLRFRVSSDFPWGWIRHEREGRLEWPMTVLPRPRMARERVAGGEGNAMDAGHALMAAEVGMEWRGMRDFRAGDRLRSVSWPASARSVARGGALLVRELDPPVERAREMTLVFHSVGGGGGLIRPDRFESALEWFWGETVRWVDRGVPVRWLADFDEWVPREIRGRRGLGEAGAHLAGVTRKAGTELHELSGRLAECEGPLRIFSDMPAELWTRGMGGSLRAAVAESWIDGKGARR